VLGKKRKKYKKNQKVKKLRLFFGLKNSNSKQYSIHTSNKRERALQALHAMPPTLADKVRGWQRVSRRRDRRGRNANRRRSQHVREYRCETNGTYAVGFRIDGSDGPAIRDALQRHLKTAKANVVLGPSSKWVVVRNVFSPARNHPKAMTLCGKKVLTTKWYDLKKKQPRSILKRPSTKKTPSAADKKTPSSTPPPANAQAQATNTSEYVTKQQFKQQFDDYKTSMKDLARNQTVAIYVGQFRTMAKHADTPLEELFRLAVEQEKQYRTETSKLQQKRQVKKKQQAERAKKLRKKASLEAKLAELNADLGTPTSATSSSTSTTTAASTSTPTAPAASTATSSPAAVMATLTLFTVPETTEESTTTADAEDDGASTTDDAKQVDAEQQVDLTGADVSTDSPAAAAAATADEKDSTANTDTADAPTDAQTETKSTTAPTPTSLTLPTSAGVSTDESNAANNTDHETATGNVQTAPSDSKSEAKGCGSTTTTSTATSTAGSSVRVLTTALFLASLDQEKRDGLRTLAASCRENLETKNWATTYDPMRTAAQKVTSGVTNPLVDLPGGNGNKWNCWATSVVAATAGISTKETLTAALDTGDPVAILLVHAIMTYVTSPESCEDTDKAMCQLIHVVVRRDPSVFELNVYNDQDQFFSLLDTCFGFSEIFGLIGTCTRQMICHGCNCHSAPTMSVSASIAGLDTDKKFSVKYQVDTPLSSDTVHFKSADGKTTCTCDLATTSRSTRLTTLPARVLRVKAQPHKDNAMFPGSILMDTVAFEIRSGYACRTGHCYAFWAKDNTHFYKLDDDKSIGSASALATGSPSSKRGQLRMGWRSAFYVAASPTIPLPAQ
jgi:hypothetical protein